MTPQQQADEFLFLWQELRKAGIAAERRLPMIDALIEDERRKGRKP